MRFPHLFPNLFQENAHLAGGWISVVRLDGCATLRRILEETENQRAMEKDV